jgi:hypothetical protein
MANPMRSILLKTVRSLAPFGLATCSGMVTMKRRTATRPPTGRLM